MSVPSQPRRLQVVRTHTLSTSTQIEAVFSSRTLYEVASVVPEPTRVGRKADHPMWVLLGYSVLARHFRSGARTEIELAAPGVWERIQSHGATAAAVYADLVIEPATYREPPKWGAFKYARDKHFTHPDTQDSMLEAFSISAILQARRMGLLDPRGPGSLTHPDRTRTIYGDGTVMRPMYRPPAAKRVRDPHTQETTVVYLDHNGTPVPGPTRRFDPDAADYHGHAGPVHGQNYVGLYVRGPQTHQRVVLAVARVPRPGLEADTAVSTLKGIHPHLDNGAHAFVYDGALRGRHIDDVMTHCGLIAINKVHPGPAKKDGTTTKRWLTLGTWEHTTGAGSSCQHHLAAVDGAVSEFTLDETGNPAVTARLRRLQVKRARRSTGRFHFNVAYELNCPHAADPTTVWVTPHAEPGDPHHRRADALRVIPEDDDDFAVLYGLRNDSESFNSQLKRTLLVDRAMSLGGRRQLLDVLSFGLLNNSVNAHRARLIQPRAIPAPHTS